MKLKEEILEFYKDSSYCTEVKKCPKLKIFLLYPATIMNSNLLNILTGIVTSLSVNIFTDFMLFQNGTIRDFLIWVLRFVFAIVLNVSAIRFSIICTILRNKVVENFNKPRIERIKDYKNRLFEEYNIIYKKMRHEVIVGIISAIILCVIVIVYPIGEFLFLYKEYIEQFCVFMDVF